MWIKICANTNLDDALFAQQLGADALGFIFASSKRQVTPQQAASITQGLSPTIEKIGVFDTQSVSVITAAVREARLTGVQLHSEYNPTLALELRSAFGASDSESMRLIQVVHWWTDLDAEAQQSRFAASLAVIAEANTVDAVLVDSRTKSASGGTGVSFDWSAAKSAIAAAGLRVIIAGGLRPQTVGSAISTLQPFGVDVASGVEVSAGIKDRHKLEHFLREARRGA